MHTRFTKNLAKMMVFAIAIPTVYTNANVSYEQDGITYIGNNVDIQTTTGAAIEITTVETVNNENSVVEEIEMEIPEVLPVEIVHESNISVQDSTLERELVVKPLREGNGVNMIEPQLEGDTYLITSADEMAWLEYQVNNGTVDTTGIIVRLENDIDFNNHCVVIGTETYPFKGHFDGQGYTISGLNFTDRINLDQAYIGLFGYAIGGSIGNVNLYVSIDDVKGGASINSYGNLVGYLEGASGLKDITVNATYKNSAKVITNLGCVVGKVSCDSIFMIDNIHVNMVSECSTNKTYTGGVIGYLDIRDTICDIIVDSVDFSIQMITDYSFGTVAYNRLGGLFGHINSTNISDSTISVTNLNVDIDANYMFQSFGSISPTLDKFKYVTISDCNLNLNSFIDFAGSPNDRGLLFGTMRNSTEYGSLKIEKIKTTGQTNHGNLAGLIFSVDTPNFDIGISDCELGIDGEKINVNQIGYGGVISYLPTCNSLTMTNCKNTGNLSGSTQISAFLGTVGTLNFTMENCENYGTIGSSGLLASGLVGEIRTSQGDQAVFRNCTNYGEIQGGSNNAGILGWGYKGVILENCKSYGELGPYNGKINNNCNYGGLIGYLSPGSKTTIKDCYVELSITDPSGCVGGLIGNSNSFNIDFINNTVVGSSENTFKISSAIYDFTFGGLIGTVLGGASDGVNAIGNTVREIHLVTKNSAYNDKYLGGLIGRYEMYGGTASEAGNITQNKVMNLRLVSESNNVLASLVGILVYAINLNVSENIVTDTYLETEKETGALIGILSGNPNPNNNAKVENNFVQVSVDSKASDLIGDLKTSVTVGGNILLVTGEDIIDCYSTKVASVDLAMSMPSYYNKDIRGSLDNQLFVGLSSEEFKRMKNFVGLDFDTVWGFAPDSFDTPTLGSQTYEIKLSESPNLCIDDSTVIDVVASHPSIESSLVYEVDDTSIAKIEGGKLIPLKDGEVKVTVRTEGLPLTEQLISEQTVSIKDYEPRLTGQDINIYQNETAPTVADLVESFELVHPFDEALNKDITGAATYAIIEIKDQNGIAISDIDTINTGEYTITIEATWGNYEVQQEVKLIIDEVIDSIEYDDAFIEVAYGTRLDNITLPTKATVYYKDNTVSEIEGITWDTSTYNPTVAGEYTIYSTITLPNGLTLNGSNEVVITKVIKLLPKKVRPVRPEEEVDDKEWFVPETKPSETVTEVQEERVVVSFKVGRDRWYINGELKHQVMDQAPELKENRAYVPLRFLSYALQVDEDNIEWDHHSKTVEIIDRGNKIELSIGSNIALLNGQPFEMDGVPYLSNGRVMLPISQIQGVFKNRQPIVAWDQEDKRVDITLLFSNYKAQEV